MSDYLNSLFADWTETVKLFTVLASITLIVTVAIITKLAWGKIIVSMIVAGAVLWAVNGNGLGWFSTKIDEETNASAQGMHLVDDVHTSLTAGNDTFVIYESAPADTYALVS